MSTEPASSPSSPLPRPELTQRLEQPDAILHPSVNQTLLQYLQEGGSAESAANCLVQSYIGTPDLCKLLLQWMSIAGLDTKTLLSQYVTQTLVKSFHPDVADELLQQSPIPPHWLHTTLDDPHWQSLFQGLAEKYPNCLVLNYAMERLVLTDMLPFNNSSYSTSITSPPTPSSPFSSSSSSLAAVTSHSFIVFANFFSKYLTYLADLEVDAWDCDSCLTSCLDLCCTSDHTYLYTQLILTCLQESIRRSELAISSNSSGPDYQPPQQPAAVVVALQQLWQFNQRLKEEVEVAMIRKGNGKYALRVVRSLLRLIFSSQLLNQKGRNSQEEEEALAVVHGMILAHSTNTADIVKLHTLYNSTGPPPSELLRHSLFLELLVDDLFDFERILPSTHRSKYVFLLATAADGGSEVQSTKADLEELLSVLASHTFSDELPVTTFTKLIPRAVCSLGLLRWIGSRFREVQAKLDLTTTLTEVLPNILKLLALIARVHPPHRGQVCEILSSNLYLSADQDVLAGGGLGIGTKSESDGKNGRSGVADGGTMSTDSSSGIRDPNVRMLYTRLVLTALLFLTQLGYVIPVLRQFQEHLQELDMALVRYFLHKLFAVIHPPYSKTFVLAMVTLLCQPKIMEAISSSSLADSPVPTLVEFLRKVTSTSNPYEIPLPQFKRISEMLFTFAQNL